MQTNGTAPAAKAHTTAARVWAVGGGKGGAGKTVVASSLAVALASLERRCVVVDADFGAANMHTVMGVPEPRWALRHFLEGDVDSLKEIACETPYSGLRLISGGRARCDGANLIHARKQKLLRHLWMLDADEVVIDLAAGSSFNVLDFFVAANQGLIVVTPELTSIENAYHFLKAAWFRSMRVAAKERSVREALVQAIAEGRERGGLTAKGLVGEVTKIDPAAGRILARRARSFNAALVVNRVASWEDRSLAEQIAHDAREALGARIRALDGLEYDESVPAALKEGKQVLERFPDSPFSQDLSAMVERLLWPDLTSASSSPAARRPGESLRRLRQALGLDRSWVEKRQQVRQLASVAASD
jgi:flagellar biosynthesis protein FlhG